MDNKEFARLLLCEATELLNEGIFFRKKVYEVSLYEPRKKFIFGTETKEDAVCRYFNMFKKDDNGKYIIPNTLMNKSCYIYEYTIKDFKNRKTDNNEIIIYDIGDEKNITSIKTAKTFDNIEELAKFIGKDIIYKDEEKATEIPERKKIVRLVLSKLRSIKNKLHGVGVISNDDKYGYIESFVVGEDNSLTVANIDYTDIDIKDYKTINKYDKIMSDELSKIEKLINNNHYKLTTDWHKLEGIICLEYKK